MVEPGFPAGDPQVDARPSFEPALPGDLGCTLLKLGEVGGVITIAAPDGSSPPLDVAAVQERKTGKNRLHLDLRADGVPTGNELERLLHLGARRVDVGQGAGVTWVVLSDPEGNEFCLLSRPVQAAPPVE